MNIKQQIELDLQSTFNKLKLDEALAVISVSGTEACDYQCNSAFRLGGLKAAEKIVQEFKSKVAVATVSPPAFINFTITDEALENYGDVVLQNNKLILQNQKPRTIFFDYGGANIAKELHVGHLRSPIVGEALKRVFAALGHKTLSDVYLGDWGLQNGLILAEMERQELSIEDMSLDLFNEIYPAASKRKNEDEHFKKRADEITLAVQQKKSPWFDMWKKAREISVSKIRENYDALHCTFDFYNGESDAQPYVDTVLDILKEKKLAYDDNNCLIIDVKTENDTAPMPPVILKKYNGGDLYATNDIATLYYRNKNHSPDEFVYITDNRQSLHFEQVFRVVKMGGLVSPDVKLTHIGFGTMNGADGKPFKTRAGGTIKFDEVIKLVTDSAKSKDIGLASLKYADLSNNVKKDYIFDLEKFTSFEGKTGPYILYTIARINSILSKIDFTDGKTKSTKDTRAILTALCKLADSYPTAATNYTLNGIADASWALANAFNAFYGNVNILKTTCPLMRASHLQLCSLVKLALTQSMDTLAIPVVEKM